METKIEENGKVSDEYGGFGCGNVDDEVMPVRDDYDGLSFLNTAYEEEHVEASDMDACDLNGSFRRSSDVVALTVDLPNVNVPPPSRPRSIGVKCLVLTHELYLHDLVA